MSFLAPLFFLGLGTIVVPILVHLIQRERKRVIHFPSLMFVQKIPYQSVRRRRIRHWFLLLMRAAAIALVVAAFARPFFPEGAAASIAAAGGSREIVILLDQSASMGYGDRWQRAADAARSAINSIGANDRATLVLFGRNAEENMRATSDRGRLEAALGTAKVTAGATRYGPALKLAESILARSTLQRREAILISDFQKSGWTGAEDVHFGETVTLTTVPVGSGDTTNLAIPSVTFARSTFSNQERITVTAGVSNKSAAAAAAVPVSLEIDGHPLETKAATVDANASSSVAFAPFTLAEPAVHGRVRAGSDALEVDNTFDFVLTPSQAVTVLIVDSGDGRGSSFYLTKALAIGNAPAFQVETVPAGRDRLDLEGGCVADGEGLGQVEAGAAAVTAVDDQYCDRLARREHEVERVVHLERVRTGAHAAMDRRLGQRKGGERDRARCVGVHGRGLRLERVPVNLERNGNGGGRGCALVRHAGRHGDALLVGERGARKRHGGNGEVGGITRSDGNGRQRDGLAEMHVLGAGPSGLLKIGDQDRLAPLERRARQDALGQLQCGPVPSGAGRHLRRAEGRLEASPIARGAHVLFGIAAEQHERGPVVGANRVDSRTRGVGGALPAVAVAHARRLVEQDDDLAAAAGGGDRGRRALGEEGPRERRHDERDRGGAHEQQEPMPDTAAPHGLVRNLLHEHQRRKVDDALALALNQVHEDRHDDRAETEKEQGGEKGHGGLPDSHQLLTARQIAEQCAVEGLPGVEERVVDALLGESRAERLDVLLYQRPVLVAKRLGDDRHLIAALEVLEARGFVVVELDLLRVEHVKDDQLVAQEAERLDSLENGLGLVVEVRQQQQDPAPLEVFGHLVERRAQVAGPLGLGAVERVQHHVEVLGRSRHVRDDVLVEGEDTDAIALLVRQIREAGSEKRSVLELGHAAARELHRPRDVEQDREVRVRVRFVLLDVVPVGARVQAPVHAADVVAGDVAAVLGEIDRGAEERRAVQAVDEAVHHGAGEQIEVADAGEDQRIHEPRPGHRPGPVVMRHQSFPIREPCAGRVLRGFVVDHAITSPRWAPARDRGARRRSSRC